MDSISSIFSQKILFVSKICFGTKFWVRSTSARSRCEVSKEKQTTKPNAECRMHGGDWTEWTEFISYNMMIMIHGLCFSEPLLLQEYSFYTVELITFGFGTIF